MNAYKFNIELSASNITEDDVYSACIDYMGLQRSAHKAGHGWKVEAIYGRNKGMTHGKLKKLIVHLQDEEDAALLRWMI